MDYIKSGRALWTLSNSAAMEYPTDPLKLVKGYSRLTDRGCAAGQCERPSDLAGPHRVFLIQSSCTDHARRRNCMLEGMHYLA